LYDELDNVNREEGKEFTEDDLKGENDGHHTPRKKQAENPYMDLEMS